MIKYNPLLKSNGTQNGALLVAPSDSIVFDVPGKCIWVKGVKLLGTDHTYSFSNDNYITLTNTPGDPEDIKIGVNINNLLSELDKVRLYIGENNNTAANAQVGNPYIKLFYNNVRKQTFLIKSANDTNLTVTTDSDGNIIIENKKPDLNHNTDYRVSQLKSTDASNFRVLLKSTADDNNETNSTKYSQYLTFNPNTKILKINSSLVVTMADIYVGATSLANATAGLVPAAASALRTYFLRGDGTWLSIVQENTWRPIKVNSSEKLGSGTDTGAVDFVAGTGITLGWDATNKKITITNSAPDLNHNTDFNVQQTPKTDNVNRPLMMINGGTSAGELTSTSMFSTGIYANASTNMITAAGFIKAGSDSSHVLLGDGSHKALSDFAMSDAYVKKAGDTVNGTLCFVTDPNNSASTDMTVKPTDSLILLSSGNGNGSINSWIWRENYSSNWGIFHNNSSDDSINFVGNNTTRVKIMLGSNAMYVGGNIVWHAGNDGHTSGLDADTLDGYHFSNLEDRYVNVTGDTVTGSIDRTSGGDWIKGRDNAIVRQLKTNALGSGWNPVIFAKTQLGGWSMGNEGGESFKLSYTLDTNYDSNNNVSTYTQIFLQKSGTIAFISDISDYTYDKTTSDGRYVRKTGDTMSGTLTITRYGPTINNYVANAWAYQSFEAYNSSDTSSKNLYHIGTYYTRDTFEIRRNGGDNWAFSPNTFYGYANNTYYLGSTTYRWANIYSTHIDVSSTSKFGSTVYIGPNADYGNYNEGIRIYQCANDWAGILFARRGEISAPNNGTSAHSWFVATYGNNFYINSASQSAGVNATRLMGHANGWTIGNTDISSYALTVGGSQRIQDGDLNIFPVGGNYNDGIRIHTRSSDSAWAAVTFCGSDNTGDTGTSSKSWFVGTYNGNLYIGKNGTGSGSEHHLRSVGTAWDCSGTWNLASHITSGGTITSTYYGPAFHAYIGNGGFSYTRYTSYNSSKSYMWDIGTYAGEEYAFHIRQNGQSNWRFNATELWGHANNTYYLGRASNRWANIYTYLVDGYKFHSNASSSTDITHIPSDTEIALETGDGGGGVSAWVWREKYAPSNWGMFHDNNTNDVIFVGNSVERVRIALGYTSLKVGGTEVSLNGHTHDDRYYTESESNSLYVLKSGDTVTGTLTMTKYGPTIHNYVNGSWAFQRYTAYTGSTSNMYDIGTYPTRDTFEIRKNGGDNWAFSPRYFYGYGNNAYYLGTTSYRWANIYSYYGDFAANVTANKFHSNASASTDMTATPPDSAIALETGNGNGAVNAWIWRENYPSNWGIFHNNSLDDTVNFVGNNTTRMKVYLGLGRVDIYGNVYATNFYTTSDVAKKQNISSFSEHIRKFQLKDTEKWHYGVIALEVEEMFRDGEEGNMTVNYNSVLSFYIGQLENKVKELEERIKRLESK